VPEMTADGRPLTPIDVAIARAIFPVLVDISDAASEPTVTFEKLILDTRERQAGQEHPIHRQIPNTMGRRLKALRAFTQAAGHPDLSCLVVSAGNGENPLPDAEAMRTRARAFDWSPVSQGLLDAMAAYETALTPRPRRTGSEARDVMSVHYFEHMACYPSAIQDCHDEIIAALVEGEDVGEVFAAIHRRLSEPEAPDPRTHAPA